MYIYLHVANYTHGVEIKKKSLVNIVYYIAKYEYFTMIPPNVTNLQNYSIQTVLIFFPRMFLVFFQYHKGK